MTRRATVAVLLALGATGLPLAGCGGDSDARSEAPASGTATQAAVAAHTLTVPGLKPQLPMGPIPGVHEQIVGRGTQAAVVLTGRHPRADRPTVIFLHLWMVATPRSYAGWIKHLTARGSTVIFPIYQDASTSASALLENATAGIKNAVRALPAPPEKVVVIGHTSGGAVAMDYAATAKAAGLPVPSSVVAIYPGRDAGLGRVIPSADADQIARDTQITVMTGPGNPVVGGKRAAEAMVRAPSRVPAKRRRLVIVKDREPAGPVTDNAMARRAFWAPVDRILDKLVSSR